MKRIASLALALTMSLGSAGVVFAQDAVGQGSPADNTKANKRDKDQAQPTADQQKETKIGQGNGTTD